MATCEKALGAPETKGHLDHAVHNAGALGEDGWPWGRGCGEKGLKSTHTPLVSWDCVRLQVRVSLKGYLLLVYQKRVHFVCCQQFLIQEC